ncbi:MAG: glycosyltransferase family 2 protein, partial [Muribaculaceae bacterium]|nr:glycosyltransferase family 2 protein [Muribaculaceae bacterium]
MDRPKFSVIIPVYNRPDEVDDLMRSLSAQTCRDFEAIFVEDGSTIRCEDAVRRYPDVNAAYYYKENEGRSIARNYGMERAGGEWFIFFDSDCVIPPRYFEILSRELDAHPTDCFGGPDAAHDSFTTTQKAINYSMTSFLTTGGIRGGKVSMEKFT